MLIAQLHAIVLPGLRKYVAFILPLALRRRCRFLYLTVVFGHPGAPFGHKKAQLLAGITLQPVINFWGWHTFKSRRKRI